MIKNKKNWGVWAESKDRWIYKSTWANGRLRSESKLKHMPLNKNGAAVFKSKADAEDYVLLSNKHNSSNFYTYTAKEIPK